MAKLYRHAGNGTYCTTRFDEGGAATRRIHPDGVVLLKRRGIRPGEDIPPFAMAELVGGNWLYSEEDAARLPGVNWAPEWNEIGHTPAPMRLATQRSLPSVDVPLIATTLPVLAPARPSGVPMWTAVGLALLLAALALYLGVLV